MKKLASLDLYTGLILVCIILLPACGWWCMQQQKEVDACEAAVSDATRRGGLLEKIGALQKKIELVNSNRSGSNPMNPRTYFEGQILAAASGGGLSSNDFGLSAPKRDKEMKVPGSSQRTVDYVVDVQWKNDKLALKLDFIESLLWNCESGATLGGTSGLQSIWKLQQLTINNMTNEKDLQAGRTPPPELEDRWKIREMKFARREPVKNTSRSRR